MAPWVPRARHLPGLSPPQRSMRISVENFGGVSAKDVPTAAGMDVSPATLILLEASTSTVVMMAVVCATDAVAAMDAAAAMDAVAAILEAVMDAVVVILAAAILAAVMGVGNCWGDAVSSFWAFVHVLASCCRAAIKGEREAPQKITLLPRSTAFIIQDVVTLSYTYIKCW